MRKFGDYCEENAAAFLVGRFVKEPGKFCFLKVEGHIYPILVLLPHLFSYGICAGLGRMDKQKNERSRNPRDFLLGSNYRDGYIPLLVSAPP